MLSKFFLRAAVTAAALTCTASAASAETFRIIMLEQTFFPELSYVQPGDVVIFENASGEARDITAVDDSWELVSIGADTSQSLTIIDGMPTGYVSMIPGEGSADADEDGNLRILGRMNFTPQIPAEEAPETN